MELGFVHILSLIATLAVVLGCGIYSSRKVKSADDFDVGGRSAGVIMVAGSIAATIIGGAATIRTGRFYFWLCCVVVYVRQRRRLFNYGCFLCASSAQKRVNNNFGIPCY
jgi:hypothetical protein